MKVINRSDGNVVYEIKELNTRRVFDVGGERDIDPKELELLFQSDGGKNLLMNYLLVDDKEWVMAHWDAPIEYFWRVEDIKKCLIEDSLELFKETLDYAPDGVLDLIKMLSWKMPLSDLNKIQAIEDKTGFNVLLAIEAMSQPEKPKEAPQTRKRLREGN